ncbi:MAG: hypothetical protein ACRDK1_11405 [Solirubrobacterales bacterium]
MDEPKPPGGGSEEGGLFGRLPSARPGVRSPRRDADKPSRAARPAKPKPARAKGSGGPKAAPAAPDRPSRPGKTKVAGGGPAGPPPPPRAERPPPAPDGDARGEAPGVEDLAWAGIAVAAEAATLGVKLLSRAVDAVRRPPDPG